MNQVLVEQRSYQMPPQDGFSVAHFLTVADVERSLRFYETVFGGRILSRGTSSGTPGYIHIANTWLHVTPGSGPTPDKPSVTLSVPANPDSVSSFMNIRVADIQACYELWRSRGAEFITEPKPKYGETRCYIRLGRPLLGERLFRCGVPTQKEELAMKLRGFFVAAAVLLMPIAALAAPGIVTTTVSLRAGPGEGFPAVDRIPGGARVNIHGCLRGTAWCDVSWSDDRGWVSSQYLEYLFRNRYVYLPDYVDEIDVPVVPFVLTSYWSSYYAGRPWYHRRAYWSGYWQSHERFATRLTIDRSAARIGRAAAARDAALPEAKARVGVEERSRARVEERTRAGVTERVTREKDIATRSAREGHERAAVQTRMTRENTRAAVREQPMARARTQTPPIMARGHDEPRAAAPRIERATPHMTQPNAARGGGGPPMNARAQMPAPAAPRAAAPAMPQGGGAPHINAAPRGGGGPGGGGGGHGQDKRQ